MSKLAPLFVAPLVLILGVLITPSAAAYEEPEYEVVATHENLELRRYAGYLVAETTITGETDRNSAVNQGFRRLFRYISGDNTTQTKIDMTAPVEQAASRDTGQKIAMTAPVETTSNSTSEMPAWTVAFIVPSQFNMDTVPQPDNKAVSIRQVPASLRVVLRFSGRWTNANINQHEGELVTQLTRMGIQPTTDPMYAFYNAPFSLPFMRRNEIIVGVQDSFEVISAFQFDPDFSAINTRARSSATVQSSKVSSKSTW